MLEVRNLSCGYGRIQVLNDVTVEVGSAESVGLFGPNGAGKTTLIGAIAGTIPTLAGELLLAGESIRGLEPHEICRRGIAVVPQDRELFPFMSVMDNLETGADYIAHARKRKAAQLELVFELFPPLADRLKQAAGTLSGGQQRMVAIGRALMASPKLLILDEPSVGLQPSLVSEMFQRLASMRGDLAILVTEQNVRATLSAVDRGYVLENGHIAIAQTSEELRQNTHVIQSYLGI
jgi:branched-chain amino acid transport system ATP-binding protein